MIFYTIYTSAPRDEMSREILDQISKESQSNNSNDGITGILLGIENKYLQYLEGDEKEVSALFEKIKKDPRHQNVTQWIKGYSNERVFSDWSMGSWMLSSKELAELNALDDLREFLDDPLNSELQSKKFIAMMQSLLKTWIAHEPERMKKMKD
ncbi:BLUF domain-containing protein [Ekhidna sp.]|uniref:BLUF domain-containing protein n=1 Tax=Ekhidna sp. TaxID=2608089 RepID=UPI003B592D29